MGKKSKKKAPKRTFQRTDRRPRATDLWVPVSVPSATGTSEMYIGQGSLGNGLLMVEFKDTLGAIAIQRMLARGAVLGMQFVMLKEDDVNLQKQEDIAQEAKDRADLELLNSETENSPGEEIPRDELDARHMEVLQDGVITAQTILNAGEEVPLYLGEAGDPNRPQIGTAKINSDGTADLQIDNFPGEIPSSLSIYTEDNTASEADNKENN